MEATEVLEEPSAARSLGRVGLVHMRQRFRPGQRSTLAVGEVIGHTPAGHAVDLGVGHATGAQCLGMHFQAEGAAA